MANIVTSIRIVCGLLILFPFNRFSLGFYIIFIIGCLSDIADGVIARKLRNESDFGAAFDTVADMVFIIPVIIMVLKNVVLTSWLVIWISIIFLIKVAGIVWGLVKCRRFVSIHSLMNRISGGMLFVLLILLGISVVWQIKMLWFILSCFVATVTALLELNKIRVISKRVSHDYN